ncbi:hypothetical protein ALC62_02231 [Cyphomyrmex costatus]|uniref:DUF5641 domain-containing protein n=1 Tax=Cyphomyrmex costatus TaxID=456900 RepID=A0A195D1R7_9HYME|nr:hypothetical protein ALC62_02231 [Cyphomyrmex costatus]
MVKLFTHHLKRIVGDTLFTFEELNTFTIEVEGILNSRPITSVCQDFWSRWNLEYLNELQIRNKWYKDGLRLEVSTIIIIARILGRVCEIHPGKDGITGAATIKTATVQVKRAAKSLCSLPAIP